MRIVTSATIYYIYHGLSSTNFLDTVFGHFQPAKSATFRLQFLVFLCVKVFRTNEILGIFLQTCQALKQFYKPTSLPLYPSYSLDLLHLFRMVTFLKIFLTYFLIFLNMFFNYINLHIFHIHLYLWNARNSDPDKVISDDLLDKVYFQTIITCEQNN